MSELHSSSKKTAVEATAKHDGEHKESEFESESPTHNFFSLQTLLQQPKPRNITPNSVLRLQRIVGNARTQKLLAGSATNPQSEIIQRDPSEWKTTGDPKKVVVDRILGHGHGFFSTWKQVKEKVVEYANLDNLDFGKRKETLDEIRRLIAQWEEKHRRDTETPRLRDIRADLPALQTLIDGEYNNLYREPEGLDLLLESPIPGELTSGVDEAGSKSDKANRIFENVNNFRFRYTADNYVNAQVACLTHEGDCRTLAEIYILVARSKGLDATRGSYDEGGRFMVARLPVHGSPNKSNTYGLPRWYFEMHFWAECEGKQYDLLFMGSPPPPVIRVSASDVHNGITYHKFADGTCAIEQNQLRRLNNVPAEKQARVFRNEQAAQDYIDANS